MKKRPLVDCHLDIAWNALGWNRDQRESVKTIREREKEMEDKRCRAKATVSFPALREARTAFFIGTILVRTKEWLNQTGRPDLDFRTQDITYSVAQGQWTYYQVMAEAGELALIRSKKELTDHMAAWTGEGNYPLGMILSMEGADPVLSLKNLERWWEQGLRAIGPAHYGQGIYAQGTGVEGPLTSRGVELVKEMEKLGFILDVTHLSDEGFSQTMDLFGGNVLASHSNCRALVDRQRQFSDEHIRRILERGGVIGVAYDSWMLSTEWKLREQNPRELVTSENVADHVDHLCQVAGHARQVAIGTDLDGGFGLEQTPADVDTIADIHKLAVVLEKRGYSEEDIDGIFYKNWLRYFQNALPE